MRRGTATADASATLGARFGHSLRLHTYKTWAVVIHLGSSLSFASARLAMRVVFDVCF